MPGSTRCQHFLRSAERRGLETLAEQSSLATRHSPLPLQRGTDGGPRRFTAIVLNVSRSLHDLGVIDGHATVLDGDLGGTALDGLDVLAVKLDHGGGEDLAGNHVVLEDGDQLVLVLGLEKALNRPLGQLAKGIVGRGPGIKIRDGQFYLHTK